MTKNSVLSAHIYMPNEFETELLLQNLLFIEKIEYGL